MLIHADNVVTMLAPSTWLAYPAAGVGGSEGSYCMPNLNNH